MKKVLYTATVDIHIKSFHLPYLKLLHDMGYKVYVATNGSEEFPYCDEKIVIPFERSPFKFNNIKAIFKLKKIIDKENFDLIHCHTPMGGVVTRLAARKARKKGTKVIYTAHGFHFYKGAPLINWLLFYPVEKWLARYTDVLITINSEDYELAKNKFKKTKIKFINGVGIEPEKFDIKMTDNEKMELRKSLGLKKDDNTIIYVAELSKRKNQSMAIKVIKELSLKYSNIKFLVVGKDSYNGVYQDLTKNLNLEDNIIFTGIRNDVPKLMKISDIAISTSRQEGLPVNIMEAMLCNLPIVATNCRGNRDLIKKDFIVELDDIKTMAEKIDFIIENKLKFDYRKDIEKYTLSNVMKEVEKIYENKK